MAKYLKINDKVCLDTHTFPDFVNASPKLRFAVRAEWYMSMMYQEVLCVIAPVPTAMKC